MRTVYVKNNGSAMIIALVICAMISSIGVFASRIILLEAQTSARYVDGQAARYAAFGAVEMFKVTGQDVKGSIELPVSYGKGMIKAEYYTQKSTKMQNENIDITSNDTAQINVSGTGRVNWNLIENQLVSGDINVCPAGNNLFVYLKLWCQPDNVCRQKMANTATHIKGNWQDRVLDNFIDVTAYPNSNDVKIYAQPVISTNILSLYISGLQTINKIPMQCRYNTIWKISKPSGIDLEPGEEIVGVGVVGNIKKEITQ